MTDLAMFVEKELSWLSFNERVLQEAADVTVPPIERVRFLGIYSSNLDEFYQVRVAEVRRRALIDESQGKEGEAAELLQKIQNKVAKISEKFSQISEDVFAALERHHIHLLMGAEQFTTFQLNWVRDYFKRQVIRHIAPVLVSKHIDLTTAVEADNSYLLVALHQKHDETVYALIELPSDRVPRFIHLPPDGSRKEKYIAMLDDVILACMDDIFRGMLEYEEWEAFSFKMIRDAEYNVNDEVDQSLIDKMSRSLKQRLTSDPVRLVFDSNMPEHMLRLLRKRLRLRDSERIVASVKYRNFRDFKDFPNVGRKYLEYKPLHALDSSHFVNAKTAFEAITQQDILLYYPYHKFSHFTEFVRQASYDPAVTSIRINIYRVAKKSVIINSLTEAVKNGKQVTVVVELRARFDEEANIEWAKFMKDEGIHVEFGIPSLKIHSKLCLITRKENGKLARYAHIGTGNFHEKTARVYTDFALFTKHKEITQEVEYVFEFIEHAYKRYRFNHLLVSPLTSRRRFYQLIDNEIEAANEGKRAEIVLKVNNLVDKGLIQRLYAASQAGVKVRGIIRGMCSLVPGIRDLSHNIKIISVVDQFLEHPRVATFHAGGEKLVYISSADWMTRNIDNRIEVSCPVLDPALKKRIMDMLDIHFKDTTKARVINRKQDNRYVARGNRRKIRSQYAIYDYLAEQEQQMHDKSQGHKSKKDKK